MSFAATPGGLCQLLSSPLTYRKNAVKQSMVKQKLQNQEEKKNRTRVSAKASTLPKDSIRVKSGPSPVMATLTEAINFSLLHMQSQTWKWIWEISACERD